MSEIILRKYHGVGNDYLIFDPKKNDVVLNERLIRQLCRRNIGVGADGILYGPVMEDKKIKVRIFNPDGSEAEKSGNGIRIFKRCRICKRKAILSDHESGGNTGNIFG